MAPQADFCLLNIALHELDIDPSTPLLYVLRNDLGLKGPRFGCGLGQCGSCSVIIDGVAIRSCVTPAASVQGEITTLEGLAKDGRLDPLQEAWIEELNSRPKPEPERMEVAVIPNEVAETMAELAARAEALAEAAEDKLRAAS